MEQKINILGYLLTPPAFVLNIFEWLGSLSINQVFTILISIFVVIFWALKARTQYLESRIKKKTLEQLEDIK